MTYSDVSTQDPDASLIAHYNYTITRTWKVTDVAGKFTTHNQVITVSDTTAPVFTVPQNDTICSINCAYSALPANTGDVTAADMADNCAPDANLALTYSDDPSNITSCDTAGYIIRNWVLTDVCGNNSKKSQIIWVEPTTRISVTPKQERRGTSWSDSCTGNGGPLNNNDVLTNTITNTNDQASWLSLSLPPIRETLDQKRKMYRYQ